MRFSFTILTEFFKNRQIDFYIRVNNFNISLSFLKKNWINSENPLFRAINLDFYGGRETSMVFTLDLLLTSVILCITREKSYKKFKGRKT